MTIEKELERVTKCKGVNSTECFTLHFSRQGSMSETISDMQGFCIRSEQRPDIYNKQLCGLNKLWKLFNTSKLLEAFLVREIMQTFQKKSRKKEH